MLNNFPDSVFPVFDMLGHPSFLLLCSMEAIRGYTLVLGLIGIAAGFLLLLAHKHHFEEVLRVEEIERVRIFESRKYRRRSMVSSLIAATGCLMSALFWVNDPKVFYVFILLILTMLLGILAIAFLDMFSVGLHSLTKTDDAARKALVDEYLRQRKKAAFEEPEEK